MKQPSLLILEERLIGYLQLLKPQSSSLGLMFTKNVVFRPSPGLG